MTRPKSSQRQAPSAKVPGDSRDKLTIIEVCAELKISRSTFYEWRAKGRAPKCTKLPNGEIRIRRAELDRWFDALEDAA